jgi:hypothetical protein
MAVLPAALVIFGTAEAVTSAVVFIEFIKEEAIQNVMMAASQALRYNQKSVAKELYEKVKNLYALELAKTVGAGVDFDIDLITWAGWEAWGVWSGTTRDWNKVPPNDVVFNDFGNGWGDLAPYSQPAFISYVNSTLLACKTYLDML